MPYRCALGVAASKIGSSTSIAAVMQTRSRKVEMPSGLSLPLAFGMYTRRRCHVAMRKARAVYALRIFKPPRRPRATWSSPRRVARGEIELT